MSIVKVNWSGGKDSSCAAMLHIERKDKAKIVCYVPMFTEKIPLLLKDHYEFITKTAELYRSLGAEVHLTTGITYYDFVLKRSTRGKFEGRMFGFPLFKVGPCGFKRDSKIKALENVNIGDYDYEDIGIAYDETKRYGVLRERKRSILCELKFTEADAIRYDTERGILSPYYRTQKRDGCTLCPHGNEEEREQWYSDYPDAVPILIELQEKVRKERPENYPLRNYQWFIPPEKYEEYLKKYSK